MDNLETKIYPYFKKNQNTLILPYSLLKNSEYLYFGFDQVERNQKEELWLIVLQKA